jgi:hypothetical protein
MTAQPEALRLADALDAVPETGADPDLIQESAAELLRLHAQRDALLEALKEAAEALEIAARKRHCQLDAIMQK